MTIILTIPYDGNNKGDVVDYDNATEDSLVAQGRATYTVNPGSAYYPLTPTEIQNLRDAGTTSGGAGPTIPRVSGGGVATPLVVAANTNAIQEALAAAGEIEIPGGLGDVVVSPQSQFTIKSFTSFKVGPGTRLKWANGANSINMMRNENWGTTTGAHYIGITSITSVDGVTFIATTATPHGRTSGSYMHVLGPLQRELQGVWKITVTGASTFTFVLNKYTPGAYTSPATFLTASVTGTSSNGSKIVTGVSSVANLYPGMVVSGTNIPAGTLIDTIDSATQFTMYNAATGANAGLTCSFPLRCCPADVDINISGDFDQNLLNSGLSDGYQIYGLAFRNVARVAITNCTITDSGAAISCDGIYDSEVGWITVDGATTHSSNAMHPCSHSGRNVHIHHVFGSVKDDAISCIGKEYTQYSDCGIPMGFINDVVIEDIYMTGVLSVVKLLPAPGIGMGVMRCSRVGGRASSTNFIAAPCYDSVNTGAYITGTRNSIGKIEDLVVADCDLTQSPQSNLVNATADYDELLIDRVEARGLTTGALMVQAATSTGVFLRVGGGTNVRATGANILLQLIGVTPTIVFNGIRLQGASTILCKLDGGTAQNNTRINFFDVTLDGCANACSFTGQQGIRTSNVGCRHLNYTGNWFNFQSSTQLLFAEMLACEIPDVNFYSGTLGSGSAVFWSSEQAVSSDGPTITVDCAKRPRIRSNITNAATTVSNPINAATFTSQAGLRITLCLRNTTTSDTAVTFGSNFKFPAGAFVQSGAGAANRSTVLEFVYDGWSAFVCVSGLNVWYA